MKNPQNYIGNILNRSVSKQTYSFTKSKRFSKKKLSTDIIYTLPSTLHKRTCSFGYGNKISLADRSVSPPPNIYTLPSFLEQKPKHSYTMSQGRESVQFGSYLLGLKEAKQLPGSANYYPQLKFSHKGGKMAIKLPSEIQLITKDKTPGPGKYQLNATTIAKSGSYFLSTYKQNNNDHRNNTSPRLRQETKKLKTKKLQTLPHCYQSIDSEIGIHLQSKYRSINANMFPKAQRQGLEIKSIKNNPGFKYKLFSQFGGNNTAS